MIVCGMTSREKALKRLGTLLRLAQDERSPEGEREAAKLRCDAIQKRWEFTSRELATQIQQDREDREPAHMRRRRRAEAVMRAQRAAAMSAQQQAAAFRVVFVGQPLRAAPNYGNNLKNVYVEFSFPEPPGDEKS